MSREDTSGAILLGGRATRLGGVAKGLYELDGEPIAARLARTLTEVCRAVRLVADDPAPYGALALPSVPDAIAGIGPAGGLLAALETADTPFVLVVAGDMSALGRPMLELLRDRDPRFECVVPSPAAGLEPLCARWSTAAAPALRRWIESGEHKLAALVDHVHTERLPEELLRTADPTLAGFRSVNTPADVAALGLRLR